MLKALHRDNETAEVLGTYPEYDALLELVVSLVEDIENLEAQLKESRDRNDALADRLLALAEQGKQGKSLLRIFAESSAAAGGVAIVAGVAYNIEILWQNLGPMAEVFFDRTEQAQTALEPPNKDLPPG